MCLPSVSSGWNGGLWFQMGIGKKIQITRENSVEQSQQSGHTRDARALHTLTDDCVQRKGATKAPVHSARETVATSKTALASCAQRSRGHEVTDYI